MGTAEATIAQFCRNLRLSSFRSTHDLALSAAKLFRALPLSAFDETTAKLTAAYPHPLLESLSSRMRHIKATLKDAQAVADAVEDAVEDVAEAEEQIASRAAGLIQEDDVIMTYATDALALQAIRLAAGGAERPRFSVILLVPHHLAADDLARAVRLPPNVACRFSCDVSPLTDLRKATKVILSAEVLTFDGTIVASVGYAVIASAARRASVPLVGLAPLYCLAVRDSELIAEMKDECGNPGTVWEYEKVCMKRHAAGMLHVWNPRWDFVAVDLVVTERGGFCPAYIAKIGKEIYGDQETSKG